MTGLEIWLLCNRFGDGLFRRFDCQSGIILKRTQWKPMLVMAFAFGLFKQSCLLSDGCLPKVSAIL